jgi:Bacteriophage lambda head decoration protein D
MALIATEKQKYSNVFKHEEKADLAYCRTVAVVNDVAGTLAVGTVLGKVTATGKYKVAVETATDGSKVAAAIVMTETVLPASTDTGVLALFRGSSGVAKEALVLDATYNDATKKAAVYASLEAAGIQVLTAI